MHIFAQNWNEMKTAEQIKRYVADCEFESDWMSVRSWCRDNIGYIPRKSLHPHSKSNYDKFMKWLDKGIPSGQIVRYGHTLGMIGGDLPDETFLIAYLNLRGEAFVGQLEVPSEKIYKATEQEEASFHKALRAAGLEFSNRLQKVIESVKPKKGDLVALVIDGVTQQAIWKSSDDGRIYLYALINGDKLERDCQIMSDNVTVKEADTQDIKHIRDILANNKMEWSQMELQFKPIRKKRPEAGKRYWYLTDKFTLMSEEDSYNTRHTGRWKIGNYFTEYIEAVEFMNRVIQLRKEMGESAI